MDVPPREWHPTHDLDEVTITVVLQKGRARSIKVQGRALTKRANLWLDVEYLDEVLSAVEVSDRVALALQVALLDRPTSQAQWGRCIRSGVSEGQEALF